MAAPVSIHAGVVFWAKRNEGKKCHPRIVLSGIVGGTVLTVNFTDYENLPGSPCIVEKPEHVCLTKKSAVWYKPLELDATQLAILLAQNRPDYPKASHVGVLKIGKNVEIECAVLEDGTRILSRAGFVRAIGRTGKVKGGADYEPESKLPVFLGAENLQPYISNELSGNSNAVYFKQIKGGVSMGYRAELADAG